MIQVSVRSTSAVVLGLLVVLSLSACDKSQPSPAPIAQQHAISTPPPPPTTTPEDWRRALESSYTSSKVKDEGDGVTSTSACFRKTEKGCDLGVFVRRDGFRKIRFFKGWWSSVDIGTYLGSYVAVPDNGKPVLVLSPYFFSKGGWLFMNKVSIMLNGEVVLEQDLASSDVKRDVDAGVGVQEKTTFIVQSTQLDALRAIKADSNILVRLTGDKGYVSLKEKDLKNLKGEIADMLFVYDSIGKALDGKTVAPPTLPGA